MFVRNLVSYEIPYEFVYGKYSTRVSTSLFIFCVCKHHLYFELHLTQLLCHFLPEYNNESVWIYAHP